MGESSGDELVDWHRLTGWGDTWALAVVVGVASVPWTYGFVAGLDLPLWPAFIAAATYYAAGRGGQAFVRGYSSNLVGIGYGAATVAIVDGAGGGSVLLLSLVVGGFMLLASLHEAVSVLSFTPGGFFGYATLFSVHAAGVATHGIDGVGGEAVITAVSMLIGAAIGLLTDEVSTVIGEGR